MNHTGFFFSGLLVGVVVSAAFGLDFFPTPASKGGGGLAVHSFAPNGQGSSIPGSLTDSTSTGGAVGKSTSDEARLILDLDATKLRVTSLEEKLATTQSSLEQRETEVRTLEDRLKSMTPDQLQAKLDVAQIELEKERQQSKRLEADLELSYREAYNLLNQFFASDRGPEHAILISEYFATSAPETLKGNLVEKLLQNNRDVIAALSPMTTSTMVADGADTGKVGVAPVSARIEASGPRPAVDKAARRGNLDAAQAEGAPSRGSSPRQKNSLPLPPPPGK